MKYDEYKEFYGLITELKELHDNLFKCGYRGSDIKFEEGKDVISVLKKEISDASKKLALINQIKKDYMTCRYDCNDKNCWILSDRYYLLCSKYNDYPVGLYYVKTDGGNSWNKSTVLSSRKNFDGSCGILTIFPDDHEFILIDKVDKNNESYYKFRCVSKLYKPIPDELEIINEVKSWKFLNDNIIIFELMDDNSITVYDKISKRILFEGVDAIKPLNKKFGNFCPDKHYQVEKTLYFDNENVFLKFFIDQEGNVVSDLFDSNCSLYGIPNKDDKRNVCSSLKRLFQEIIEDYKKEGYQLVLKK